MIYNKNYLALKGLTEKLESAHDLLKEIDHQDLGLMFNVTASTRKALESAFQLKRQVDITAEQILVGLKVNEQIVVDGSLEYSPRIIRRKHGELFMMNIIEGTESSCIASDDVLRKEIQERVYSCIQTGTPFFATKASSIEYKFANFYFSDENSGVAPSNALKTVV